MEKLNRISRSFTCIYQHICNAMYMKEKPMLINDWRQGYALLDTMHHYPCKIAFSTPHSMISEPRMGELSQLKMSYISKKKEFQSEEEVKQWVQRVTTEPGFLNRELQRYNPTEEETHYFKYKELLTKANECSGVSAMKYVLASLLYTYKPIDAFLWIGSHITTDLNERYSIYWKACLMAEYAKRNYEKPAEPELKLWTDHWFRPSMRGIACFYTYQLNAPADKKEEIESVQHLRELMQLDTDDPMGLRFILMGYWNREDNVEEMQTLYDQFPADHKNPLFLYPMACMKYRTLGETHPETATFVEKAMESNIVIPLKLFQEITIKPVKKSYYFPGTKEEADYFFLLHYDMPGMADDQMKWLHTSLCKFFDKIRPEIEKALA